LAIDPFFEEERVKKYFNFNLLKDGILPIFIIVENQSENLILIHPDDLILAFSGPESPAAVGGITKTDVSIDVEENSRSKISGGATLAGFLAGGVAGLLLASIIVPDKDYTLIRYNIRNKLLLDKTLSTNEVASGFVFLKVKDKSELPIIRYFQVRIKNLGSGDMETFICPLTGKKER